MKDYTEVNIHISIDKHGIINYSNTRTTCSIIPTVQQLAAFHYIFKKHVLDEIIKNVFQQE